MNNSAAQSIQDEYKLTEVGVIPTDWNVEELSNIVDFKNGKAHENFIVENGKYIVVNSKFISTEGEVVKYSNEYYCPTEKNSILMVMSDVPNGRAIAKCFLVDENKKYTVNQRICSLKPKIDPKFLFYILDRNPYFISFDDGVKQTNLRKDDILVCKLGIPTNPLEQSSIGNVLYDINVLIQKTEKLIAKKKAIKQGAMQELLTGKRRLPGFSGKWEEKELGELTEIKDGTHQTPKYVADGIPFYSVESVTNNDFINTKFISRKDHKLLTKKYKIEEMDILMTRIGSIGECKLIDWKPNASFYVSLALIKPRNKLCAPYIYHFSKTKYFKKEVEDRSLQWAIPKKINLGEISKVKIYMPIDQKEQNSITELLSDMENEIELLEQKLEKFNQIKQGAMQVLLTGKIRLIKN